ncbi:MAG: sulfatase-like hydrolase/transferase, partial [Planctomycetia bacterium]
GLADDTLVLFLTDNGEATAGYNAGLRGRKTEVYDGGIRSPFFARWPGVLPPGPASSQPAAHLDVLPTLLEACGLTPPAGLKLDGRSLWPLLTRRVAALPERTLFFQAHRGDAPVSFHNMAARGDRWKLVRAGAFGSEAPPPGSPVFELFDMHADPFETRNRADDHPAVVADLKKQYEAWFADVGSTRPDNYAPPRMHLGSDRENPVILTRQDWRGADGGPAAAGHWLVDVVAPGRYSFRVWTTPTGAGEATVRVGDPSTNRWVASTATPAAAGTTAVDLPAVELPQGRATVEAVWKPANAKAGGVRFVEIKRLD